MPSTDTFVEVKNVSLLTYNPVDYEAYKNNLDIEKISGMETRRSVLLNLTSVDGTPFPRRTSTNNDIIEALINYDPAEKSSKAVLEDYTIALNEMRSRVGVRNISKYELIGLETE